MTSIEYYLFRSAIAAYSQEAISDEVLYAEMAQAFKNQPHILKRFTLYGQQLTGVHWAVDDFANGEVLKRPATTPRVSKRRLEASTDNLYMTNKRFKGETVHQ